MTEDGTGIVEEEETGREGEVQVEVEGNREERTGNPRKSPMELLVMRCPMNHLTCLLYPGLYFVSLDLPILLISVVPVESRNVFSIFFCVAWDTYNFSVILAWVIYVLFTITSFVLTLKDTVDLVIRRLLVRCVKFRSEREEFHKIS